MRDYGKRIVRDLVEILCAAGLSVIEGIGFAFAFCEAYPSLMCESREDTNVITTAILFSSEEFSH
jgi:hypothetical protein